MTEIKNTKFYTVMGSGMPEVDGLYVPSTEPPKTSESGTVSSLGYWNGKMAWDRADGKANRSPSLSYSNSYKAWRLCRLDGHLAYECVTDAELPPTDVTWSVYKKGVAPAPKIIVHETDPRIGAKPNVVFVLGGPGAGKGTMCELAEQQLGWTHLSAGDLLRAERAKGGPNAALIEEYITAGKIVPVVITVKLLQDAMAEVTNATGKVNFLIDGFPRSIENWNGYKEVFGMTDDSQMPTMLFFECPLPVLEKRVLKRAKHSGRSDDNIESLRKRFNTFKQETMETVNVFRDAGKCVEVDSSNERQAVYALVKDKLSPWTNNALGDRPLSEKSEMHLGLRPWPSKAKKDDAKKDDAKKDDAKKDKVVDHNPKLWGYQEIAFAACALAVVGIVIYKNKV